MTSLTDELWFVDFGVSKSIRYHSKRRAFFESLENLSKLGTAIVGASAFGFLLGNADGAWAKGATAVVTLFALSDLILGFGRRAKVYDELYRRFSALAIEIANITEPTEQDIRAFRAKRLAIEADEPGVLIVLDVICRNEEARARRCESSFLIPLTKWQRAFAQFVSLPPLPQHTI